MHDNKVSEKAIWEGSITPDNDTPSWASQMPQQPQMMFCYKCNNVIPGDSIYCPYCQVKLFTECPKCGVKYSSQYPACNQCGTNRSEFLQMLRKEEERERQERLKRYEQQENEKKQKEAYFKENEEIMKTKEYKTTYSLLSEAFKDYEKKANNMGCVLLLIPLFLTIMFASFLLHPILGLLIFIIMLLFLYGLIKKEDRNECQKHLQKYISSRINNDVMTSDDLINMVSCQGKERLSDCCIIAYRKKRGLPINYKWHYM